MTSALSHPASAALLGLQGRIAVPEELFFFGGGLNFVVLLPNCLPLSAIPVPCTFE